MYPLLLYVAIRTWGVRAGVGLLLLLLVPRLLRLRLHRRRELSTVLVQLGAIGALSGLAFVLNEPAFLQQLPVLINGVLLATFAASLVRPPPMIERYARLVHEDLSPAELRHCRVETCDWVGYIVANIAFTELLVLYGSLAAWTLWCGGVAYAAMGCLFAGEYVVRKLRFGRLGTGPVDRLLARLRPDAPPGGVRE